MATRGVSLPNVFRKLVVKKLSTAFSEATEIITLPMPIVKPKDVIVKSRFLGINASDVNITAGRYFVKDPLTPYDAGLESLGEIVAVGRDVRHLKIGQTVAYFGPGAFAEYLCVPAQHVIEFPDLDPNLLAILNCGLTSAIGLEKAGHIHKRNTVLVTAAAGGTGILAVQYAKYVGCHVIGTCSSDEKIQLLKKVKCDRPVNYNVEDLNQVLKEEYPNGVDILWDSVGSKMFEVALKNIAPRGRLIIAGFITQYKSKQGFQPMTIKFSPAQLLLNSASVSGFMVFDYEEEYSFYLKKLQRMYYKDSIQLFIDCGDRTDEGQFIGLESISRAVEYLYSGRSMGKVIVAIPE